MNCNTKFTAYKLHCSSCSKQYVGSYITYFCDSAIIRLHFGKYRSPVKRQSLIKNMSMRTLNCLSTMVRVMSILLSN